MTAAEARALFVLLGDAFAAEQERLGRLDAAVGDGDHGAGMARGFAAAAAAVAEPDAAAPGELFVRAGRALMSAVGGASGPLFATLFLEIGAALAGGEPTGDEPSDDSETDATGAIAAGLDRAAERIMRLGRAAPGDKTLLEALLPAAAAFRGSASAGLPAALAAAAAAAERGVRDSAALPAQRGRARYIEGAGVGHPDPGAVSIALIFSSWSELAGNEGQA